MTTNSGALGLLAAYDSSSDDDNDAQIDDAQASSTTTESPSVDSDVRETTSALLNASMADDGSSVASDGAPQPATLQQPKPRRSAPFVNFRSGENEDEIALTSDESSDSSDSSSDGSTHSEPEIDTLPPEKLKKLAPKTKGELAIDELPKIEHLQIEAPVDKLVHLGRVKNVMDTLVTIQSFKNTPALDLDSVLFLRDGQPLGSIFEVFGQVVEPLYLVRFNSAEEIGERGIAVDMPVYFATNFDAPITSFVFVEQLRKMRGTDASWKDNNEPPEDVKDYSDDEEERRDKQKQKAKRKLSNAKQQRIPRAGYTTPSALNAPPNTPANSYLHDHGQATSQLSNRLNNLFSMSNPSGNSGQQS